MNFDVNSPIIFVVVAIIVALVLGQSVFFLVKALKRAKELGMDKKLVKKTVTTSATFTIAPAISILVGVVTLSVSLGVPLPWLRLSVVGSLSYEQIAAGSTLEIFGFTTADTITDPSVYVTVALVMTIGIALGLFLVPLLTKKIQGGMISLEKKDKKWMEIFNNALFMGMISAFLGYVFCDVSNVFRPDEWLIANETTRFAGIIPVLVFFTSAIVMAILGVLSIKTKKRWLTDYALPISLIVGMAAAIPITAWLG